MAVTRIDIPDFRIRPVHVRVAFSAVLDDLPADTKKTCRSWPAADIADRDFRNDTMDAGEVDAGHTVTALYEIKLSDDVQGRIATVYIRYQDPESGDVQEVSREFHRKELAKVFEEASPRFQLSAVVAEYAEILRESFWAQESSLEQVSELAQRVNSLLSGDQDVEEFTGLVVQAGRIASSTANETPIPDRR